MFQATVRPCSTAASPLHATAHHHMQYTLATCILSHHLRSHLPHPLLFLPRADKRYQRHDKRDKLPAWITSHFKDSHLNLSTDMLLCIAREFMRGMAQPYDRNAVGRSLLSEAQVNARNAAKAAAAAGGAAPMDVG